MTDQIINITQSKAARLAGFIYLLAIGTTLFGEFYVPAQLYVSGDVVQTANNIIAQETLYRLGFVGILITFIIDVPLIWALYIVVKPIDKNLAWLAVFWRLVETSILCVGAVCQLIVLKFLNNADYLKVFEANQLFALARMAESTYGSSLYVGFIFLGLGSTVFAYLLFKSNYIPKLLSGWGIFSSLLLSLNSLAILIFPDFRNVIFPGGFIPMFIYELTLGCWLLIKSIKREVEEV